MLCCAQVAKTLAPSVIYIDEVEKVFVSDKKKQKEFGGQVRDIWQQAMHMPSYGFYTFCAN